MSAATATGTTAAAAGAGAVVRQGHLRKLKTMKKKYFVLRAESPECSARLEYYESEKKFRAGAVPRRVLPLKSCYNITRRLDLKQKHVIALFTREEQFCVVAENEQELHAWLAAILRQHWSDDHSEELLHPIQHVWQVNVQKKGLGASKNIQGLYNLCLTDKTLTLVKIKSQNNVISDLGIPERVEYSLKNIRRCGDSECFFYMEVGRQTVTGAGELWMHTDDSNIAQSMHSTIYHAMRNCAKETENEKDHIVMPKGENSNPLPARRQTYSDGRGRAGLANEKGLCVGSCIKQCVCSTTYSIDDSAAAVAPLTPKNDAAGAFRNRCDSMPSRTSAALDTERPPQRHSETEGTDVSRDEPDSLAEWHRTPRIPEEPDYCEMGPRELLSMLARDSRSAQHSRTSSLAASEPSPEGPEALLAAAAPEGYLPMAPSDHGLVSASSGSVCSGTPSTDPRFSEYQLEPAMSHIVDLEERPPRAYSVGSRPHAARPDATRLRAYSVGARNRPPPPTHKPCSARSSSSAPLLPRASADDLMELDFSHHKVVVSACSTPPSAGFVAPRPVPPSAVSPAAALCAASALSALSASCGVSASCGAPGAPGAPASCGAAEDSSGYVEMRPGDGLGLSPPPRAPDGYVEMNLGTRPSMRPLALADPLGLSSETLFPLTLDAHTHAPHTHAPHAHTLAHSPPDAHPLATLREISEEAGRKSPPVSSSPSYVALARAPLPRAPAHAHTHAPFTQPTVVKAGSSVAPARFSLPAEPAPPAPGAPAAPGAPLTPGAVCVPGAAGVPGGPAAPVPGALNYAALDLQPRAPAAPPPPRQYTQIDFQRLHCDH